MTATPPWIAVDSSLCVTDCSSGYVAEFGLVSTGTPFLAPAPLTSADSAAWARGWNSALAGAAHQAIVSCRRMGRPARLAVTFMPREAQGAMALVQRLPEREVFDPAPMLAAISDGVLVVADDGTVLEANDEAAGMVGRPKIGLVGASIGQVFRSGAGALMHSHQGEMTVSLRSGGVLLARSFGVSWQGSQAHLVLLKRPASTDPDGGDLHREIFNAWGDAMLLVSNTTGRVEEANQAAEAMFAMDATALRRTNLGALVVAYGSDTDLRSFLTEGGTCVRQVLRGVDVVPVELTAARLGGLTGTRSLVSVRDLTDRQSSLVAWTRTKRMLDLALERNAVATFDWNVRQGRGTVSDQWFQLLGYTRQEYEAAGLHWDDVVHPEDKTLVRTAVLAHHLGQNPYYEVEYRVRHRDGVYRTILERGCIHERGDDGRYLCLAGLQLDITNLRDSQFESVQSAKRLNIALAAAGVGLWDWNLATGQAEFSDQWAAMLGYELGEFIRLGVRWSELIHPEDWPRVDQALEEHKQNRTEQYEALYRMRHRDGSYRWVLDRGRAYERDTDGTAIRMAGTHVDVTEREEALQTSRESQRYAALAAENAQVGIFDWPISRKGGYVNDVFLRIHGITRAEYEQEGFDVGKLVHPEDTPQLMEAMEHHLRDRTPAAEASIRIRRPDGTQRQVALRVQAYELDEQGRPARMAGTAVDVTEQVETMRRLEVHQRYMDLASQALGLGMFDVVRASGEAWVNDAYLELLGVTREQWEADRFLWRRLVHPDDLFEVTSSTRAHDDGFAQTYEVEYRFVLPTGEIKRVFERGTAYERDAQGRAVRVAGVVMDITDRERNASELEESRRMLALAVESAGIAMWEWDIANGVLWHNEQWAQLLGYTREGLQELQGDTRSLMHPEDAPVVNAELLHCINRGREEFEAVYRMRHADGSWRWMLDRGRVTARNDDGVATRMTGAQIDITERKRLDDELAASEERYRNLFVNAVDAIFLINVRTDELTANRAGMVLLGCTRRDLEQRRLQDFLVVDAQGSTWFEEVYRSGTVTTRARIRRLSGAERIVDFRASMVGHHYVQVIARDITQEIESQHTLQRRERLMHAISSSAEKLLGQEQWEPVVESVLGEIAEATECVAVRLYSVVETGEAQVAELRLDKRLDDGASRLPPRITPEAFASPLGQAILERLEAGEPLHTMVSSLRELYGEVEPPTELAVLACPLFVHGSFWGWVNLYRDSNHPWSEPEMDGAMLGTRVLGAAVGRAEIGRQLAESERRFRELVDQSPVGIATVEAEPADGIARIVMCNRAFAEMNGYTMAELIGKPIDELNVHGGPQRTDIHNEILSRGAFTGTSQHERKDGSVIDIEFTATLIESGGKRYVLGLDMDVSERRRAERLLARRERLLAAAGLTATELLATTDMTETIGVALERLSLAADAVIAWYYMLDDDQDGFTKLAGYRAGHGRGVDYPDSICHVRRQGPLELEYRVLESGEAVLVQAEDLRARPEAEGEVLAHTMVMLPVHVGGRFHGFFGLELDEDLAWTEPDVGALQLTAHAIGSALERADIVRRLAERENWFRTVVDKSPIGISVLDASDPDTGFRIVDCNEAFARTNGWDRAELLGQLVEVLTLEQVDTPEARRVHVRKVLEHGVVRSRDVHRSKDGRLVDVEYTSTSLQFEGATYLLSLEVDITDRLAAEELVRRRERLLKSVSTMASRLLGASEFDLGLSEAVETLGFATDSVAAWAYEFVYEGDEPVGARLISLFHRDPARQAQPSAELAQLPLAGGFASLAAPLLQGDPVLGRGRDYLAERMRPEDDSTFYAHPIFAGGRAWGFIGLNGEADRHWLDPDLECLRIAAATIGAAAQRNEITEKLAESEQWMRTLVERSPVGIAMLDASDPASGLVVADCNDEYARIHGYKPSELIGNKAELFNPGFDDAAYVDRVREEGVSTHVDGHVRKDGVEVLVRSVTTLVEVRERTFLLVLDTDVTESHRAAEALERRDAMLAAVAEAVLLLLQEPDLDRAVPRALEVLGTTVVADRAYIFEDHLSRDGQRRVCSQRFEWVNEGIGSELDNPELQGLDWALLGDAWRENLVAGRAVRSDISSFPDGLRDDLIRQGIQSLLLVPIHVQNEFWGFMGFDSVRYLRDWADTDAAVLTAGAAAMGSGIARHRSAESLNSAHAELQTTLERIQDGVFSLDEDGRFVLMNEAAASYLGSNPGALLGRIATQALGDLGLPTFAEHLDEAWRSHESAVFEVVVEERNMWLEVRVYASDDGLSVFVHDVAMRKLLENEVRQQLHEVRSRSSSLEHERSQLVQANERLQRLATTDGLTGLRNHRFFQDFMEELWRQGGDRQVSMMMIDIDHFKSVNDTHGHPVGDELLRQLAERFRRHVRRMDLVARYGGEEFAIVLPDSSREVALRTAERIREEVERMEFMGGRVTVSVGVAERTAGVGTRSDLISAADGALYEAKNSGRNRVIGEQRR